MPKENNRTALLIMDVQQSTLRSLKDPNYYLHAIARALKAARSHNVPVIYSVIGFRAGYPEVHLDNKAFAAIKAAGSPLDKKEAYQIPESVGPKNEELVITKKRFSAFTGSDLEVILRSKQINHLILAGISSSGVVLSTLREAADKDFKITVLVDGCEDRDDQIHEFLMTKIFPKQAAIQLIDDWADQLDSLPV